MLDTEFKYFKDHQKELVEKFNGKFVSIVGQDVVGVFDTELDAYTAMKQKYAPGTFLIQLCEPGETSYTQTFHSRVAYR